MTQCTYLPGAPTPHMDLPITFPFVHLPCLPLHSCLLRRMKRKKERNKYINNEKKARMMMTEVMDTSSIALCPHNMPHPPIAPTHPPAPDPPRIAHFLCHAHTTMGAHTQDHPTSPFIPHLLVPYTSHAQCLVVTWGTQVPSHPNIVPITCLPHLPACLSKLGGCLPFPHATTIV